jgi:signal peptidase II
MGLKDKTISMKTEFTNELTSRGIFWLWIAAAVFIADRISKLYVLNHLTPHQAINILPFFNLSLIFNSGAAFSLLSNASGWQGIAFCGLAIIVSLYILKWLWRIKKTDALLAIALSCVLGGAIGNLYDRIFYKYVIDFLDIYVNFGNINYHWPTFNLADSCICIGGALLVFDVLRKQKHTEE